MWEKSPISQAGHSMFNFPQQEPNSRTFLALGNNMRGHRTLFRDSLSNPFYFITNPQKGNSYLSTHAIDK